MGQTAGVLRRGSNPAHLETLKIWQATCEVDPRFCGADLVEPDLAVLLGRLFDRVDHLRDSVAEGEVRLGRPSAIVGISSRALMIFWSL
jgi:hypothetical protein